MATYDIKRWENSYQRGEDMMIRRTNIWQVQSSIQDDDAEAVVKAVFGGTVPGRLQWQWTTSEGPVTDSEVWLQDLDCRLRNRDESRALWIVRLVYVDLRGGAAIGRNRNSDRQIFPQ